MLRVIKRVAIDIVGRMIMGIFLVIPGLILIIDSKDHSASALFSTLRSVHIPLPFYGLLMVIAGLLILFSKLYRDLGYTIGAIITFIFVLGAVGAILQGKPFSVLVFFIPVVVWAYLRGIQAAAEGRDSQLEVNKEIKNQAKDAE